MSKEGLDLDQLMDLAANEKREKLSFSQAREMEKALFSAPFAVLQAEIQRRINGKLNQLVTQKLGTSDGVLEQCKTQGEISGLRQFWEIAKDLIDDPQSEAIT